MQKKRRFFIFYKKNCLILSLLYSTNIFSNTDSKKEIIVKEYTLFDLFDSFWLAVKKQRQQKNNFVTTWLFGNTTPLGLVFNKKTKAWDSQWSESEKLDFLLSLDIEEIMCQFTFSPPKSVHVEFEYQCYSHDGIQEYSIEIAITCYQAIALEKMHDQRNKKSA